MRKILEVLAEMSGRNLSIADTAKHFVPTLCLFCYNVWFLLRKLFLW